MSIRDLMQMSLTNLLRRKLRTFLTVLGVVIGTASIVVMLSLGLGLKRSSLKQIEQYGGITTITVYPNEEQSTESGEKQKVQRLDDKAAEQVGRIPHVKVVSPVLQIDAIARIGRYQAYINIKGMTAEALRNMRLKIGRGSLPAEKGPLQLFFGNQVIHSFYSIKGNGEAPKIDPVKDTIFYIFDMEAYNLTQNGGVQSGGNEGNSQPVKPPKKYLLPVCGILDGGPEVYSNNSYEVYADLDALKAHVKKAFKNKAIPGQPTGKKGKPLKGIYYNSLYVSVDGMSHVEEVQKAIREMGFQENSNIEWLQQMQQQMKTIQMVLGGIGAVSLFVAAIGIANTMMMSIYERTKEIGILKVLGCDLSDIRRIFLIEAGSIGLAGGMTGLVLSYGISSVINFLAKSSSYENISYIPIWLVGLAVFFSVLVGIGAGFLPAFRAMRLSPLSALRND